MTRYRRLAIRHDKSHMDRVIEGVPDQIAYALADDQVPTPSRRYDRCVVLGMGGSALPVDVIKDAFLDGISTGSLVSWRRYGMPPAGDEKTLYIASSFSGATEETLDALNHLIRQGCAADTVVIAAHGDLIDVARKHSLPFVRLPAEREPSGFQPRSATGYFVAFLVRILEAAGILHGALEELRAVPDFLRKASDRIRAEAEETAQGFLRQRIPVILTDDSYERSIGRIFTIKLYENAKRPALHASLPEANHNLMIGFSRPRGFPEQKAFTEFGFLYMSDPDSDPRVHARFQVMQEIFKDRRYTHVDLRSWEIAGETRIQKIFAALVFADWCSYTLALLDGEDPTPVDFVEQFKRKLADSRRG